jgi:hypothetical protein
LRKSFDVIGPDVPIDESPFLLLDLRYRRHEEKLALREGVAAKHAQGAPSGSSAGVLIPPDEKSPRSAGFTKNSLSVARHTQRRRQHRDADPLSARQLKKFFQ